MCVYVYVYVCRCVYACMCLCVYVCMCLCMCMQMCVHVCMCMCVCVYVHVGVCIYVYVCRCVCEGRGQLIDKEVTITLSTLPVLKSGFSPIITSNDVIASVYCPMHTNTVPMFCKIFSLIGINKVISNFLTVCRKQHTKYWGTRKQGETTPVPPVCLSTYQERKHSICGTPTYQ